MGSDHMRSQYGHRRFGASGSRRHVIDTAVIVGDGSNYRGKPLGSVFN